MPQPYLSTFQKNTKTAHAHTTHIHVQNYKYRVSYVSYKHTSYTKHTVLDLFNVCSNHAPLNYGGQDSKNSLQFTILTNL